VGYLCKHSVGLHAPKTESLDSGFLLFGGRLPAILHVLDQRWVSLPIKDMIDTLPSSSLQGFKTRQVSISVLGP